MLEVAIFWNEGSSKSNVLYRTATVIVSIMIQVRLMAYYDGHWFCNKFNQIFANIFNPTLSIELNHIWARNH